MNTTHCGYGEGVPTVHRKIREHDLDYHKPEQNDLKVQLDKKQSTGKPLHPTLSWLVTTSLDLSVSYCHPEAALPSLQSSLQRNKQQPFILQTFTCLVSLINSKRERGQIVINAPLCSKIQHSSYTALHPNLHGAGGKMSLKLLTSKSYRLASNES